METKLSVNHQAQADFILHSIAPYHTVVGYGLGDGIHEVASHCGKLIAVEHNREVFDRLIQSGVPKNVDLLIVEPNPDFPLKDGEDGNWDQFEEYVKAPIIAEGFEQADVIIISGRARVACSEFAEKIAHKDTQVFITDYNHPQADLCRIEYFDAERHLIFLNNEFTTHRAVIRSLNPDLANAHLQKEEEVVVEVEEKPKPEPEVVVGNDPPPPPPASDPSEEATAKPDKKKASSEKSDKKSEKVSGKSSSENKSKKETGEKEAKAKTGSKKSAAKKK